MRRRRPRGRGRRDRRPGRRAPRADLRAGHEGAGTADVAGPTTPSGSWPWCSPRARPGRPRAPCSATASWPRSPPSDVGRSAGAAAGAMLAAHPVRPHRVHDQAALVPAHSARPRTCSTAGAPPTCCGSIADAPHGQHRRRGARRSRCCCAIPTSTSYDLSRVKTIVMGGALSPPGAGARGPRARSAPRTRSATRRPSRAASAPAPRSTPTTTRRCFTVGRPRGGVELEIRDEDDRPASPTARSARSCLRSPAQMRGYWRDPEATADDAPRRVAAHRRPRPASTTPGCLRLAGRAKEMFIRGGYNVYPLEVEAVLASHPAVAEVVVVASARRGDGRDRRRRRRPRDPDASRRRSTSCGPSRPSGCRPTSCPRPCGSSTSCRSPPMQKIDRKALAGRTSDERRARPDGRPSADADRSSPDGSCRASALQQPARGVQRRRPGHRHHPVDPRGEASPTPRRAAWPTRWPTSGPATRPTR